MQACFFYLLADYICSLIPPADGIGCQGPELLKGYIELYLRPIIPVYIDGLDKLV